MKAAKPQKPAVPEPLYWTDADGDRGWLDADPEDMDHDQIAVLSVAERDDGQAWRSVYISPTRARAVIAWLTARLNERPGGGAS